MSVNYDATVLRGHAIHLYWKGKLAVVLWTIAGVLAGLLLAAFVVFTVMRPAREPSLRPSVYDGAATEAERRDKDASDEAMKAIIVAVSTTFFGLVGLGIGFARRDAFRLQAQLVLCQVEIEANTRRAASNDPAVR